MADSPTSKATFVAVRVTNFSGRFDGTWAFGEGWTFGEHERVERLIREAAGGVETSIEPDEIEEFLGYQFSVDSSAIAVRFAEQLFWLDQRDTTLESTERHMELRFAVGVATSSTGLNMPVEKIADQQIGSYADVSISSSEDGAIDLCRAASSGTVLIDSSSYEQLQDEQRGLFQRAYPPPDGAMAEQECWEWSLRIYPPDMSGFAADSYDGVDRLNIRRDVLAFAQLFAYKDLRPPLCVGIFGDWGSGKTFFMRKVQEQAKDLSESPETSPIRSEMCSNVVQIDFNAWHYMEDNLWASLGCRIFEGLAEYVERHEQKDRLNSLLQELVSTKERIEEVKTRRQQIDEEIEAAKKTQIKARTDRQEKDIKFKESMNALFKSLLEENSAHRSEIETVALQLGLPNVLENLEHFRQTLKEARTLPGRIKRLTSAWAELPQRVTSRAVFCAMLSILLALPYGKRNNN